MTDPKKAGHTHPFLRVRGIKKSFGSIKAVKGVDLECDKGEITGLLGPNGAGKTTTFKMTVGLLTPDTGTVYLKDNDITTLPMYKRARLGIGYLSQEPAVFTRMTVKDNLLAILETMNISGHEADRRLKKYLSEFNLTGLSESYASSLSGGERRRLEIARVLLPDPSVIFLDEPFSGVDPISVAEIQTIIKKLRDDKNIGILITDHNVRETLSITDRTYIIQSGNILTSGSPDEVVRNPVVKKAYLGENFTL